MVESQPSKLLVAGSIPVSRSSCQARPVFVGNCGDRVGEGPTFRPKQKANADVAQLAEHVIGNDEVTGSDRKSVV